MACFVLASGGAQADGHPSEAMMATVRQLVQFMSALPAGGHAAMLSQRGLCIVENFPPYLFCGAGAARRWEHGFRAHAAEDGLAGLEATFGEAQDFGESANRVYFSLPTTWTGRSHGRGFEEQGAWAFVLERTGRGWRVQGYGWGVISYRETPP